MKARMLLLLLLVPTVAAVEEADAPAIDARIERVWHEPAVPQPGQQWQGFLQLASEHNVTAVAYQICRVGQSCFAPPTPATDAGNGLWTFDTRAYGPNGETVDWGINFPGQSGGDWRVGVQYVFTTAEGNELVPEGLDVTGEDCADLDWEVCAETHYFAFTMPARAASEEAPGLPMIALLAAVLVAFRRR